MHGLEGVDVGHRIRVQLIHPDVNRGPSTLRRPIDKTDSVLYILLQSAVGKIIFFAILANAANNVKICQIVVSLKLVTTL
jgi:hypothetical protein